LETLSSTIDFSFASFRRGTQLKGNNSFMPCPHPAQTHGSLTPSLLPSGELGTVEMIRNCSILETDAFGALHN
jgi:hypothetical protein